MTLVHKIGILCITIVICFTDVQAQDSGTDSDMPLGNDNFCRNMIQVYGEEVAKEWCNNSSLNVTTESTTTTTTSTVTTIIVTPTSVIPTSTNIKVGTNNCATGQVCVPYYLCVNGTIAIHGSASLINLRGAEDGTAECMESLEKCCPTNQVFEVRQDVPVPIKTALLLPNKNREGCGYRNEEGVTVRITGNTKNETEFGEFPWMAAIFHKKIKNGVNAIEYLCGGSVIHPSVIVTALHYFIRKEANDIVVRGGEWDIQGTGEHVPHQDRMVREIIKHENYYKGAYHNDIALLILTEPFIMNPFVQPVCLPPPDTVFNGKRCFVTGWGADSPDEHAKYAKILKKIDVPIVPNDECQEAVRKNAHRASFELHESFICAGGEPGKDACKGDGGSPLVCPIPNTIDQYYQAGIVSWGIGCGDNGVPAFYASIPYLRSWIDRQLDLKNIDKSSFMP